MIKWGLLPSRSVGDSSPDCRDWRTRVLGRRAQYQSWQSAASGSKPNRAEVATVLKRCESGWFAPGGGVTEDWKTLKFGDPEESGYPNFPLPMHTLQIQQVDIFTQLEKKIPTPPNNSLTKGWIQLESSESLLFKWRSQFKSISNRWKHWRCRRRYE